MTEITSLKGQALTGLPDASFADPSASLRQLPSGLLARDITAGSPAEMELIERNLQGLRGKCQCDFILVELEWKKDGPCKSRLLMQKNIEVGGKPIGDVLRVGDSVVVDGKPRRIRLLNDEHGPDAASLIAGAAAVASGVFIGSGLEAIRATVDKMGPPKANPFEVLRALDQPQAVRQSMLERMDVRLNYTDEKFLELAARPTSRRSLAAVAMVLAGVHRRPPEGQSGLFDTFYAQVTGPDVRMAGVRERLMERLGGWQAEMLYKSLAELHTRDGKKIPPPQELFVAPDGAQAPVLERRPGDAAAKPVSPGRGSTAEWLHPKDAALVFQELVRYPQRQPLSEAGQRAMTILKAWDAAAPEEGRLKQLGRLLELRGADGPGVILQELFAERLVPRETVERHLDTTSSATR